MTTIATLIARPFALHSGHALLRFERGPARAIPQARRRPWYTQNVTLLTIAARIRALATERRYDKLDSDAQRALRREIADELGTRIQNVAKALVQTGKRGQGAPRDPHIERCPACQQALRSEAARAALQQVVVRHKK